MASYYWIKLYHEVLDDPKMGLLPDNLWRRTIELFLLAGELDQDGKLPTTEEIAWWLRQSDVNELLDELNQIARIGIISKTNDGWLVKNFEVRQAWSYSDNHGPGYIYLICRPDGAHKIGLSRQPHVRLKQIESEFPGSFLVATFPADDMQTAEAKLHCQYKRYRLNGEWFDLDPNQTIDIRTIQKYSQGEFIR